MNLPPERSDLRLDLERRDRLGMVEAIWGQHKSAEQIVAAVAALERNGEITLVTRLNSAKAQRVLTGLRQQGLPPAAWCYDAVGHLLCSARLPQPDPLEPAVAIVAGEIGRAHV